MAKSDKGSTAKKIAAERIEILFAEAKTAPSPRADRYVHLARELAMKQRIRLTRAQKRSFCRKCGAHLVPGQNLRVRIQRGRVIHTCMECGNCVRIPLKPKKGD
ncbi:MAG TPA: ribonuclease P [Methanocorpusculum sp.]|nr:ribonuclease P [Methanocorpusculum sp.]